jgi:hypothetical protein
MSASLPSAPIPTASPSAITGPLSIADLLDRTFRAMRARFGVLILSAAMVMVPLGVVTALLSGRYMTGYFDLLQYSMTDTESAELAAEQFLGNALGYFGVIMLIALFSFIGSTLITLMSMHHIHRFLHGESSTVAEGWRVATGRFLPMIGMQIIEFLIMGAITAVVALGVGIIIFIVALAFGGAMAALGDETASIILGIGLVIVFLIGYLLLLILMITPILIFMSRWIAAAPTLLIEKLGPWQSLQRSWALTKGRMWRSILYIVLLTTFSLIVIGVPVWVLQGTITILMPGQIALMAVISTLASYVLNLFYQPFYATGIMLFYYDLRVRAEAYDVALRVAALEAELLPDAPPA